MKRGIAVRIKHALVAWTAVLTAAAGTWMAAVPAATATTHPGATGAVPGTQCSTAYFDGNSLLGPQTLPAGGPIAPIVRGYQRLAGLSEKQFLATYWDLTANGGQGGWRYPPDNGFLIVSGHPVEFPSILWPGQEVDRFGSQYGSFLAPEDTPYAERALPPQSLDDFDPAFTCNYHLYLVLKPFKAEAGPIAPGFGQPGLGLQYQLVSSLLAGDPATANVMWLISNGYLRSLN
jgi:Tuberculosis necrotizing toxin